MEPILPLVQWPPGIRKPNDFIKPALTSCVATYASATSKAHTYALSFNRMKDASHKMDQLLPAVTSTQYDMRHCNNMFALPRSDRYRNSFVP